MDAPDISLRGLFKPYRFRAFIRAHSPGILIDRGWMAKGADCEARGGAHFWFNIDDVQSGCYFCKVIREGQIWKTIA